MSIGSKRIIAMITYILLIGLQPVSGQTVDKTKFGDRAKEGFKKSCIANQISAKDNENVSSDIVVRYCDCVARHGIEVLSVQEFEEAAREGHPSREVQIKLNALGQSCASCISGPPCKDE